MDSINFLSVSKALVEIFKQQNFEDCDPSEEEQQIAQLLAEKLELLVFDYISEEEIDNSQGNLLNFELFSKYAIKHYAFMQRRILWLHWMSHMKMKIRE